MSDVHLPMTWRQQLAGRWQIPLLLASMVALGAGVWRLRPVQKPPEFEPLYAHAVSLYKAELYPEAAGYIESLVSAPERSDAQKRRLCALLAQVIFDHEQGNVVHGETNSLRIIDLTQRAAGEGGSFDAPTSRMRATAYEWLHKPEAAVVEYEHAVAKGIEDPWTIRRRILDIRRTSDDLDDSKLHEECLSFLSGQGVADALAYWAAEQVVELLSREKKFEEAERFLASQAERFRKSTDRRGFDYLQALILFHVGKRAEAERLLRTIRDDLEPSDPVFARAGLLLGRMQLDDQAPEYALAYFDDVLNQVPAGPLRSNAVLGRAEALDALDRHEEALAAYGEAIQVATESPYDSPFDSGPVSASDNDDISKSITVAWRLPKVTRYLRTVARRAELTSKVGRETLAKADHAGASPDSPERLKASNYLKQAGEYYERLAGLVMLDDDGSTTALLSAADAFELAGEHERTSEVLQMLIREHPQNPQVPAALLRLGQTYQAAGRYDRAVNAYQQNLIQFPRTLSAIASMVPLAECFQWMGQPDKAEQTLLRLIQHQPGDPLGLVTPAAKQFQEALFGLADLYSQWGRHEQAIGRYEEALERYPEDPRGDRSRFLLAEACRRSSEAVRAELKAGSAAAFRGELGRTYVTRLERARQLYGQIIDRYRKREPASLTELERLYMKLSYLYAADTAFELSAVATGAASQPSSDVLTLYEQAAWACAKDPIAMSAYVQMVNCHLRAGRQEKARMALQRAHWVLRNIPDQAFEHAAPSENRAYWENYLAWLEKTPTMAATQPAAG